MVLSCFSHFQSLMVFQQAQLGLLVSLPRVAEPILQHYKLYKTIPIQVEKMSYMV